MPPINPKKGVYFNEWGKYPAQWLRNLYPESIVDERSINDVKPNDIKQYRRCHFFAGIGGWEYALELAGWPKERSVWTGSCPCQPFSTAGRQSGFSDERHLWPVFGALIKQLRPPTVFGEQVAGKLGLEWLDGVRNDLENENYSFATACLPAGAVGAPHRRYRLFWVANTYEHRFNASSSALKRTLPVNFRETFPTSKTFNDWNDYRTVRCRDAKLRRIKSNVYPLAYGIPGSVGAIHAYGNAIVPQVAAMFIRSFLDTGY